MHDIQAVGGEIGYHFEDAATLANAKQFASRGSR
jgi:hypothetical protein